MPSSTGYTLTDYGSMILDNIRMPAYAEALRRHVKPGMVVADLGAGTGVFSLLACKLGAARVYAIEPDSSILVARESAAANGYADRMFCIQGLSIDTKLPERVDLLVSDLRGSLPLLDFHVPAIRDARERLLKPDGCLIPQRDVMRCAPIKAPKDYARLEQPWDRNDYDLDLGAARKYVARSWWQAIFAADQLLAEPMPWATMDYASIVDANVDGSMDWTIERAGILHGLAVWFDAELCEGIGYSNAPGLPDTVYGQRFIPLTAPVTVVAGDRLHARLRANLVHGDYVFRWDTSVTGADGLVKASFSQTSLGAAPMSTEDLAKRVDTYTPTLNEKGRIECFVLEAMTRGQSLRDISQAVTDRFPQRFANWRSALDVVAELSAKYSD